jgi:hypothetical protein
MVVVEVEEEQKKWKKKEWRRVRFLLVRAVIS